MENHNEKQERHLEFKRKCIMLVALRRKVDKAFIEGRITKKRKKEIKEKILLEWDKAYNKHPYISLSVKQGFN